MRFRFRRTERSKIPAPRLRPARASTARSRSRISVRSTSAVKTAHLAPDPRHPGLVYGDSSGGGSATVTREIPATGWEQNHRSGHHAAGNGLAQHVDAAARVLAGRPDFALLRSPERLSLARRRRDVEDRQPRSLRASNEGTPVESRSANARRDERSSAPRRRLRDRAVAAACRPRLGRHRRRLRLGDA